MTSLMTVMRVRETGQCSLKCRLILTWVRRQALRYGLVSVSVNASHRSGRYLCIS